MLHSGSKVIFLLMKRYLLLRALNYDVILLKNLTWQCKRSAYFTSLLQIDFIGSSSSYKCLFISSWRLRCLFWHFHKSYGNFACSCSYLLSSLDSEFRSLIEVNSTATKTFNVDPKPNGKKKQKKLEDCIKLWYFNKCDLVISTFNSARFCPAL